MPKFKLGDKVKGIRRFNSRCVWLLEEGFRAGEVYEVVHVAANYLDGLYVISSLGIIARIQDGTGSITGNGTNFEVVVGEGQK